MSGIVNLFQFFRSILVICPCCGDLMRLGDLTLKYKGKAAKTWLDTYEGKVKGLEKKEMQFEEREQELREAAIERGRKQVPSIIHKSLSSEFRSFRYNPYDIKALLHPVDFIVFNGMTDNASVSDVVFLSKKAGNPELNKVRKSIESTVEKGNYSWQVARVDIDGKIEFSDK